MQWLLCLSLVIVFSHAQIEHNETVCGLPALDPGFQSLQEDVPFCVVIRGVVTTANGSLASNTEHFTVFYPEVDKFTLFEVASSSVIYRNESWVRIEIGNDYISEERQYSSNDNLVTAMHGFFRLRGGRPGQTPAWVWDPNARELCEDGTPVLGDFCADTRRNCDNPENNLDCDLQIYTGWDGTDINDRFLTSSESLLSNFRQYSTADLYVTASESAQDAVNNIPRLPDIENPFPFP